MLPLLCGTWIIGLFLLAANEVNANDGSETLAWVFTIINSLQVCTYVYIRTYVYVHTYVHIHAIYVHMYMQTCVVTYILYKIFYRALQYFSSMLYKTKRYV